MYSYYPFIVLCLFCVYSLYFRSGSPSREKSGKRMPDLVSTRRDFFPENYNSRGRSRPFGRRPYINRRARGRPFFRTYSNRYYNNYQRQNSR